jgi:rRNA maturation endonuclease Nob1
VRWADVVVPVVAVAAVAAVAAVTWFLVKRKVPGGVAGSKTCPACGQRIPDLGSFCPICGQKHV